MRAIQGIGQGQQEDQEDRVQRQALENQLMQMKTSAADPSISEAIQSVESKELEELHNDDHADKGATAALDRLKGRKDSFTPWDETLNDNEEQAANNSIEGLKRSIESMERRALDMRDPKEVEELNAEIRHARIRLQQKGSDAYRRQFARYTALFTGDEVRPVIMRQG